MATTAELITRRHPLRESSRRFLPQTLSTLCNVPQPMEIENCSQPLVRESRCESRRAFGTNIGNCVSKGSLARPAKKQVSPPRTLKEKKVKRAVEPPVQELREVAGTEAMVYEHAITQYIQRCEECAVGFRDFMQHQTEIDSNMRAILVNWLVDVHDKFKLRLETLFMAINLTDRYLNEQPIARSKLQLLGITALLIASKYEQIYVPDIKRFVDVCNDAYRLSELLQMQGRILLTLNFTLTHNSSLLQMQHKSRVLSLSAEVSTYCSFILQLCLLQYRMCQYKPSLMALSSIYLSNKLLNTGRMNSSELMQRFGIEERAFKSCLKDMFETYRRKGTPELQAVKRKFARLGVL